MPAVGGCIQNCLRGVEPRCLTLWPTEGWVGGQGRTATWEIPFGKVLQVGPVMLLVVGFSE